MRAARAHLSDGGMLALRVPNGACYAAFRPLLRGPFAAIAREWLAQNNLLGFPYRYGFTPTAIARLVERNGMRVERVVGDVLVPIADKWTKRWAALEERLVKRVIAAGARISHRRQAARALVRGVRARRLAQPNVPRQAISSERIRLRLPCRAPSHACSGPMSM